MLKAVRGSLATFFPLRIPLYSRGWSILLLPLKDIRIGRFPRVTKTTLPNCTCGRRKSQRGRQCLCISIEGAKLEPRRRHRGHSWFMALHSWANKARLWLRGPFTKRPSVLLWRGPGTPVQGMEARDGPAERANYLVPCSCSTRRAAAGFSSRRSLQHFWNRIITRWLSQSARLRREQNVSRVNFFNDYLFCYVAKKLRCVSVCLSLHKTTEKKNR